MRRDSLSDGTSVDGVRVECRVGGVRVVVSTRARFAMRMEGEVREAERVDEEADGTADGIDGDGTGGKNRGSSSSS